jgi:hypothetical protein
MLGAGLSALLQLTRKSPATRIPEQIMASWITFTRPAIGAAAALAAYPLLQAGLLGDESPTVARLFFVAFAAGFSERLIIRGVESVAGKDEGG